MTDIQAGDVVVCVDDGPDPTVPLGRPCILIKARNHYRVERVWVSTHYQTAIKYVVLKLAGVPSETVSGGYGVWRFRKVKPATEEFTARIKAIRPIREDA